MPLTVDRAGYARPGEERKAVDTACNYLLKYKKFLRYDEALEGGLPIGTGVIEGTCKSLIVHRMERTGARWSLSPEPKPCSSSERSSLAATSTNTGASTKSRNTSGYTARSTLMASPWRPQENAFPSRRTSRSSSSCDSFPCEVSP